MATYGESEPCFRCGGSGRTICNDCSGTGRTRKRYDDPYRRRDIYTG